MSVSLDDAVKAIAEFGPNCLLGICCPPAQQSNVLAHMLDSRFRWSNGGDSNIAHDIADYLLEHFDLMPKDSVTPLLRLAGKLAAGGTP
jgi:hypothetical protein